MKATREEVFLAINGEREYQDSKWSPDSSESGGQHNVSEWLIYIENYINEAKNVLSRQPESKATEFALHTIRKIGGMAVACMEQNGALTRQNEGTRPAGYSAT